MMANQRKYARKGVIQSHQITEKFTIRQHLAEVYTYDVNS